MCLKLKYALNVVQYSCNMLDKVTNWWDNILDARTLCDNLFYLNLNKVKNTCSVL